MLVVSFTCRRKLDEGADYTCKKSTLHQGVIDELRVKISNPLRRLHSA